MTLEEFEHTVHEYASSGKSVAEIRESLARVLRHLPLEGRGRFYASKVLSGWITANDQEILRIIEST